MRLSAILLPVLFFRCGTATWQIEYFNQLSTCMNLAGTNADVSSCTWVEINNDSPSTPYIKFNFHDTALDTSTTETLSLLIERPQSQTDQGLIQVLQSSTQQNEGCIFFNWFEICSDRITSISTADLLVTIIHEGRQADLTGTCTFPVLQTGQQIDFTATQNCAEINIVQDYATFIISTLQESETIATKAQFCNPDYTNDGDDTNDSRTSLQDDAANVQSYQLAYNFQTDAFNFIKTCKCGFTLGVSSTSAYDDTNPSSVALTCNYNADYYVNQIDNSGFCVGDISNCDETTTDPPTTTLNTCGAYIQGLAPQIIFNTADGISRGTCEAIDSSTYAITCDEGYKTSYRNNVLTYCDTQICVSNECNQDNNQGTCTSGFDNGDGTIDRTTSAFHNSKGYFCTCGSTAVGAWFGLSCQKNVCVDNNIDCINGDCIGGSVVNDYQCVCHDGWTTPNPSSKQCSTDINECTEGTAQCDSTGTNNCVNVNRNVDSNGYVCNCKPEYAGVFCTDSIDDCVNNPCGDGGSCTDGVRTSANHAYTCTCNEGYELVGDDSGLNGRCDRIRQCASSPCLNGAVCQETPSYTPGANNYICNCPAGWEGDQCETDINECLSNNGLGSCNSTNTDRCIDQAPPTQYVCVCNTGFQGKTCDQVKESIPTVIVNFNQNFDDLSGILSLSTTEFNNLISGGFVCDPNHNGDGIYTSADTGDALTFYNGFEWFFSGADYINSGLAFENNANFDSSTLIAGTASFDIQCNSGNTATMKFTGIYLEDITNRKKRSIQKRSLDFGSGFGSSTSTTTTIADVDACAPYDDNGTEILNGGCLNGAVCVDQPGDTGRTCTCPAEWTGDSCDILVNSCGSNPCQNGATCSNKNIGYECSCTDGFTGDNCEVDTFCTSTHGISCVANGGTCTAGVCTCDEFGIEDTVSSTFGFQLPYKITDPYCGGKDYCFDGTENGGSYNSSCGSFGTCVSSINSFACECDSTHDGNRCENELDLCTSTGLTTTCAGSNNQGTCQVIGTTASCSCSPGFFSSDSSNQDCDLIDPCFGTNNDCVLDSTDTCTSSYVDASTGYTRTCNCLSGYSGDTCSDSVCDVCDVSNTQSCYIDNGTAVCMCADGFGGSDCSGISCIWGTITAGNCVCNDGWRGTNCDLAPDCGQFGSLNTTTGYCDCINGWGSEFPDRICRIPPNCDAYGHGDIDSANRECECLDGWTGTLCDTPPVCNPAHSTYNSTSGLCVCSDCYSDVLCLTPPSCGNYGSLSVSGLCVCTNGYSGCDCSIVPNCGDHGTLTNGLCDCQHGWSGDNCETQPNCGAYGTFNATTNRCDCNSGYSGDVCSVHAGCQHGVLTNGACVCHDGWGLDSGICTVEPDCGTNGTLNINSSKCECDPGYSGTICEIETDCGMNGVLNALSGNCDCNNGYTGNNCENQIDCGDNGLFNATTGNCDCDPGYIGIVCATLGNCLNGNFTGSACVCEEGWTGDACELETLPPPVKPPQCEAYANPVITNKAITVAYVAEMGSILETDVNDYGWCTKLIEQRIYGSMTVSRDVITHAPEWLDHFDSLKDSDSSYVANRATYAVAVKTAFKESFEGTCTSSSCVIRTFCNKLIKETGLTGGSGINTLLVDQCISEGWRFQEFIKTGNTNSCEFEFVPIPYADCSSQ